MILLTGITGKTGGAAADAVLAKGLKARAIVRDASKAARFAEAGIELIEGDVADKATVEKAMEGVERAFLTLPNSDQQLSMENQFTDIAKAAGVKLLVKMSSMEAVPDATGPIPKTHVDSENYIKASGLNWTFIKPNFFMQNLFSTAATVKEQGKFFMPFQDGKTGMADLRDIGAVVAEVLAGEGHEGKIYEVTGPELISFGEVGERMSDVLGKPVEYVNIPMEAYMEKVAPFLTNQWHIDAVTDLFTEIAEGGLDYLTDTCKELTGRDPISVKQFIEDHKAVFGG